MPICSLPKGHIIMMKLFCTLVFPCLSKELEQETGNLAEDLEIERQARTELKANVNHLNSSLSSKSFVPTFKINVKSNLGENELNLIKVDLFKLLVLSVKCY